MHKKSDSMIQISSLPNLIQMDVSPKHRALRIKENSLKKIASEHQRNLISERQNIFKIKRTTIYQNESTENQEMKMFGNHKRYLSIISQRNNSCYLLLEPIGVGGYGKVWKAEKEGQLYAIKEMSKKLIYLKRSVKAIFHERQLLANLQHKFIANMICSYQDQSNIYLVLEYAGGGDLRHHQSKYKTFTEEQTREFFIACTILGLEYLHSKDVIHRDIKPENLLLDSKGYVKITDFGIARIFRPQNSDDTSGTLGYMSPEVLYKTSHTFCTDFYALGVVTYEFMLGRRPFNARTREEYQKLVAEKNIQLKPQDLPLDWSHDAADFINKLLTRKASSRLGFNHISEIKYHPWFRNTPWKKILSQEYESPFVPSVNQVHYNSKTIQFECEENEKFIQKNLSKIPPNGIDHLYKDYDFNRD